MHQFETRIERLQVAGERLLFADLPVEGVKRGDVLKVALAQQRVIKARCGIGLVLEFFGRGAGGIHHQDDGERLLGLVLEHGDLLFGAIIVDLKLVLAQRAHNLAGLRLDGGDDADQIDVAAEDGGLLR